VPRFVPQQAARHARDACTARHDLTDVDSLIPLGDNRTRVLSAPAMIGKRTVHKEDLPMWRAVQSDLVGDRPRGWGQRGSRNALAARGESG